MKTDSTMRWRVLFAIATLPLIIGITCPASTEEPGYLLRPTVRLARRLRMVLKSCWPCCTQRALLEDKSDDRNSPLNEVRDVAEKPALPHGRSPTTP